MAPPSQDVQMSPKSTITVILAASSDMATQVQHCAAGLMSWNVAPKSVLRQMLFSACRTATIVSLSADITSLVQTPGTITTVFATSSVQRRPPKTLHRQLPPSWRDPPLWQRFSRMNLGSMEKAANWHHCLWTPKRGLVQLSRPWWFHRLKFKI